MSNTNKQATTATEANKIQQTRQQLLDKLQSEQKRGKELIEDLKAIAILVKKFQEETQLTKDISFIWAFRNRKAIIKLIEDIIKVLKTKNIA